MEELGGVSRFEDSGADGDRLASRTSRPLASTTAPQLMPCAGVVAAALAGSNVALVLPNQHHALWTIVTCYALWGLGMLGSMMVLAVWYQRVILCGLPSVETIPTMFLPIAPTCLGALS